MAEQTIVQRFDISAPGKVILHGEHSVVYGHPAIAGSIGLRTYLTYTALASSSSPPQVIVEFRSIPFTASLPLDLFDAFLRELDCNETLQPDAFLEQLRSPGDFPFARFVSDPAPSLGDATSKERMSLGSTLYIINRVLRSEGVQSIDRSCLGAGGFQLSLHSEMSIGAGLGSSASYGVCLAAGAYHLARILKAQFYRDPSAMSPDVLKKIYRWSFDSEIIMHVKPSGIDNEIATNGGLVRFRRGTGVDKVIKLRRPVRVLIVDTGVSRSTAQLVAAVAKRLELFPRTVGPILESMGGVVDEAVALFESEDHEPDTVYDRLSTLVNINNNLLRSVGVSHPALEAIFAIAERAGFASKLTGAGGGGCAFVLLPDGFRELDSFQRLVGALAEAGFRTMETTVGTGAGVTLS
ncbi:mevalonate kinase-like [Anopheles stephensi]|uniref:mevalonate kinase-like n=1 Tax=Anopheles stephensi TaxID=30069 RepID=UPI0016588A7A|nr:mevalonate kinase-like [Anopheles stephensi]